MDWSFLRHPPFSVNRKGAAPCLQTTAHPNRLVMHTVLKIKIAFAIAFCVMLMTAAVPFISMSWVQRNEQELLASQRELEFIREVFSLLKDAETGQRGFVITGNESFLEPYYAATSKLESQLPRLLGLTGREAAESEALHRLQRSARLKLDDMAASINMRRTLGFAEAQASIQTGRGKAYMDQVRDAVNELVNLEEAHREALRQNLNRRVERSAYLGTAATAADILLLTVALIFLFRLLRQRENIAQSFRVSSERLNAGMQELEQRNREISLIGQMARALESQISFKEAFNIISVFYSKLMPGTSGVLYLFRNSGNLLEKEAQWGAPRFAEPCLLPDACWALRRGQPHLPPHSHDLPCPHCEQDRETSRLCLPLMAQGEVLGLILIECGAIPTAHANGFDARLSALAVSISEQVALALSNARLRKVLKEQSILDPLTGMFNRRYMEETLRREIARAQRLETNLSVIVLDVDHFKRVNDTAGHDAGDLVLQAIAQQIRHLVRESDAPCRFGGEEFVLVLPDCDKAAAMEKAEQIAGKLRALELRHDGNQLAKVTASIGVACFPDDAATAEGLVQMADEAMYFGKKNGRDQVVAASGAKGASILAA